MEILKKIEQVREVVRKASADGKLVGLVPTMGALHAGHISLIDRAVKECNFVVVSIFVNPTQFEPGSDLENYPKDIDRDVEICKKAGVDVILAPMVSEIYPEKNITWVNVEGMTDVLCGANREGHFRGVCTVCSKLFNIVSPNKAYFGQKDAQQLAVIKRMVKDLDFDLEIVGCETVREDSGLAMSSRNAYLSDTEKKEAALLYGSLQLCELLVAGGERNSNVLIGEMRKLLEKSELIEIEYIEIVDNDSLEQVGKIENTVLAALAARVGKARLIDNVVIEVKS